MLALTACIAMAAFGRPNHPTSSSAMTEDDFRKLEQTWLDAAAVPDLPTLQKILSDQFMGTSFGHGVLSKEDVVPPQGMAANHMPKCVLKDSTVHIFGDTAVLMGRVEMEASQKADDIRITTVFQKTSSGWEVIAIHMSKA